MGGISSDFITRPETSTQTKVELKQLRGATRYTIKIASENSKGTSLYSDEIVFITKIMGVPYGNTELL